MVTDIGKTNIIFGQLIKAENLRITFTDKKKPVVFYIAVPFFPFPFVEAADSGSESASSFRGGNLAKNVFSFFLLCVSSSAWFGKFARRNLFPAI